VKHESSLASIFKDFMQSKAPEYGCRFHWFPLDGQDRDAGADYLLTDSDRFAIVEFKYADSDLVSERLKPKRLTLCQKLLTRADMCALHDRCHFISWTHGPLRVVKTNIYRNEVCTRTVFGPTCGLPAQGPTDDTRASADLFTSDFFDPAGTRSLSLAEFEGYVAWLLTETSASTRTTLELIAHNPNSNDLALVQLNSLAEAQAWVRKHVAPPPPAGASRRRHGI
jgi:hypothetical protein